jgi:PKD repeat protein
MRKGVLALVLFGLLVAVSMFTFVKTPQANVEAFEEETPTRTDPYNLLTDYRDVQWSGWDINNYQEPWNQQWHNWSTYRRHEMYDQTEFWFRCKNMTEDYQWLDDINATTNGDEVGLMKEDVNLTQSQDNPMNFSYPRSDRQLTARYYEEMHDIGVVNLTINPLGLTPNPFQWTNPLMGSGKELNVEVWVDTNGDYDYQDPAPDASIEGIMRFDFNWWDTPYDPADPGGTIEPYTTVAAEKNSPTLRQMEEFADGIGYWLDLDEDGHPNVPGDINGGRIWVLIWRSDNEPDDLDERTMDLILYCGYTEKLSWISLPYLHPKQLPVADTGDDMGFPENRREWENDPEYVDPIFNEEYPQIKEGETITFDATHSYDPQDDVGADGIGYGHPDWPGEDTGEGNKAIDNGFEGGDGWRSNNYQEVDRLRYQWEAKVRIPGNTVEQTIRISGGFQSSPIYDWRVKLPAMDRNLPADQQYLILNVTLTVMDPERNQHTDMIQVLAYKSQNAPQVTLTVVPQIPEEYENLGEAWVLPQQQVVFNGYAFDPDPNSELFFHWDFYGPYGQYYHYELTNIIDYKFDEPGEWNITLTVYDGEMDNINTLSGNDTMWVHVIDNNDPVPVIRASHNPTMETYVMGHINSTKNRVIYFNGSMSYDPDIWLTGLPNMDDEWAGMPGFDEDGDGVPDVELKYQWDWGDGTRTESFSTDAQAEYKWQDRGAVQTGKKHWPVTLRIWDGRSTVESDPPFQVFINLPPTANAGPNLPPPGEEIEVGMTVEFDGSGSYDPNDDPNYDNKRDSEYVDRLMYTWDFGDGSSTVMGREVEHVYDKAGTFTVMLTVSDGEFTDTSTTKVKIIPANQGPVGVVEITSESWKNIDTREVYTNVRMTFDASQSYDPDGDAYLDDKLETNPLDDLYGLTWDLGDGTVSKQPRIDHIYEDNGTYTVTIMMADEKGVNWSESYTINVANRAPIAVSKEDTATSFSQEQPVMLSGEGSYDEDGEIIGYYWEFGDGTHSDLSQGINGYLPSKVVAHTYERTGLYTVKLFVMDDDGTISEEAFEINVQIKSEQKEETPFPTGAVIGGSAAFVAILFVASSFFVRMRKRL